MIVKVFFLLYSTTFSDFLKISIPLVSGLLLMFKGKFEFLDIVLDKIDFC